MFKYIYDTTSLLTVLHYATTMQYSIAIIKPAMPSLTIKNIPDELYDELKHAAELHRRSINSEVLTYLERMLQPDKVTSTERIKRAETLRADIKPNAITPEEISNAINSGRP